MSEFLSQNGRDFISLDSTAIAGRKSRAHEMFTSILRASVAMTLSCDDKTLPAALVVAVAAALERFPDCLHL